MQLQLVVDMLASMGDKVASTPADERSVIADQRHALSHLFRLVPPKNPAVVD
jgi:hypothetical protein